MKRGVNKEFKFITEMPVWTDGRCVGRTKYSDLVGKNIIVKYFGETYSFEVLSHNKNKNELLCKYKDNEKYIRTSNFISGKLGCLLQKFNRDILYSKDDIVDNQLLILDVFTKKREFDNADIKYYKYECLKCGNIDEISQIDLVQGIRCNVCCKTPRKIVKEINSIWKVNFDLVKFFKYEEDTYNHTSGSDETVWFKCPDCSFEYERKIYDFIKKGHKCPCCGDGKSYGEKIMCNVLRQLELNFKMEKIFNWSKKKRYDFYLIDYNILLETHGKQHYYDQGIKSVFQTSLEEEVENDRIKKELALNNGILEENYIVIDCRKSELEWIKNSILESKFNELFDLSNIDWNKCSEYANGSLVLQVASVWNNSNKNTNDLAKEFLLSSKTIREYLHRCTENNLLTREYNGKLEGSKAKSINGKKQGKAIRITFKNGNTKNYINFKTASDDLGISVDAIRNLIGREKGFQSRNSINGYNDKLDGLKISLVA